MQLINPVQETILRRFGDVPESQAFYLTGGTALALFYLQHRKSNDLDFFTPTGEIIVPFSHHLEETLKEAGLKMQRRRGLNTFVEFFVEKDDEATVIQLAQDSAFRFDPPKEFPPYHKLKVDSLTDLASNKLLALFGRATLRDFIDVFYLVEQDLFDKKELMAKAQAKDPGFDLYWLGVAFERIKDFNQASAEMHMVMKHLEFDRLQTFFDQWRQEISKKLRE